MSANPTGFIPPDECPICGAEVPPGAKACPSCGADERSGWNEDETRYDGLDLPESAFEGAKQSTFDRPISRRTKRTAPFWWITGIALTALIGYLVLRGRF